MKRLLVIFFIAQFFVSASLFWIAHAASGRKVRGASREGTKEKVAEPTDDKAEEEEAAEDDDEDSESLENDRRERDQGNFEELIGEALENF